MKCMHSNAVPAMAFFFVMSLSSGAPVIAYSQDTPSATGAEIPQSTIPAICEASQIELFSCRLETGRTASLCLDYGRRSFAVKLKSPDHSVDSFPFSDLQEVHTASAHASESIVKGVANNGYIGIYDWNGVDPEGGNIRSALVFYFKDKKVEHCDKVKIYTIYPVVNFNGKDVYVNLYSLKDLGLATSLNDGKTKAERQSRQELLRSWPYEK